MAKNSVIEFFTALLKENSINGLNKVIVTYKDKFKFTHQFEKMERDEARKIRSALYKKFLLLKIEMLTIEEQLELLKTPVERMREVVTEKFNIPANHVYDGTNDDVISENDMNNVIEPVYSMPLNKIAPKAIDINPEMAYIILIQF